MHRLAQGCFNGFQQCLGHGRVGVDGDRHVLEECAHLEGEGRLANKLADASTDGDHPEQKLGIGITDRLDETAGRRRLTRISHRVSTEDGESRRPAAVC